MSASLIFLKTLLGLSGMTETGQKIADAILEIGSEVLPKHAKNLQGLVLSAFQDANKEFFDNESRPIFGQIYPPLKAAAPDWFPVDTTRFPNDCLISLVRGNQVEIVQWMSTRLPALCQANGHQLSNEDLTTFCRKFKEAFEKGLTDEKNEGSWKKLQLHYYQFLDAKTDAQFEELKALVKRDNALPANLGPQYADLALSEIAEQFQKLSLLFQGAQDDYRKSLADKDRALARVEAELERRDKAIDHERDLHTRLQSASDERRATLEAELTTAQSKLAGQEQSLRAAKANAEFLTKETEARQKQIDDLRAEIVTLRQTLLERSHDELLRQSLERERDGDIHGAVDVYDDPIAKAKEEVFELYLAKAEVATRNGLFERAWETYRSAELDATLDQKSRLWIDVGRLANLMYKRGFYRDSIRPAEKAAHLSQDLWGAEHPNTLLSFNNLGLSLKAAGRYSEAEPLYRLVLKAREQALGPEDPKTLGSMNNLASLLKDAGRYSEAESLHKKALESRERLLGPNHSSTLASVNNLANLFSENGRYSEAEPLYRRTLEAHKRLLGDEHPDTFTAMNNLANVLNGTGHYLEAEPLYRLALEGRQAILGTEHPDTLSSIGNLANLLAEVKRYEEAEPLFRRALETRERTLGAEHPDTLASTNNLANLLSESNRHVEAEPLFRRALEIEQRVLGAEHPETIATNGNLASLLANTGREAEAEPLYRRSLEVRERVLGTEHFKTFLSAGNLGICLVKQGVHVEGKKLVQRATDGLRHVLGEEHPHTTLFKSVLESL